MDKTEFLGKLQLCYFGDRNALEEIVSVYDDLQQRIEKAIEYLENTTMVAESYYHQRNCLLNILKGDDTNE